MLPLNTCCMVISTHYYFPYKYFVQSLYIKRELSLSRVPANCSAVCGLIWLKLLWMVGRSWVPLPPGGALIGHQVALLEGKEWYIYISAVCGPIWLILRCIVGVGHGCLATRWRPNQPPGGAPSGQRMLYFSCLWSDLADTLVDGRSRSLLPCHQVAPWSPTRWHSWRAKSAIPWAPILREQCLLRVLNERSTVCVSVWAKWAVYAESTEWASSASDGQMTHVCVCHSARAKWAVYVKNAEWASNASDGQMAPVCDSSWAIWTVCAEIINSTLLITLINLAISTFISHMLWDKRSDITMEEWLSHQLMPN